MPSRVDHEKNYNLVVRFILSFVFLIKIICQGMQFISVEIKDD